MFEATEQRVDLLFGAQKLDQIAMALDVSEKQLEYLLDTLKLCPHRLYYRFSVPKRRRGAYRTINAPRDDLKRVQRRIALLVQARSDPSCAAHGFIPERSIITNAQCHVGKRCLLNIDLEDFFDSINALAVSRFLTCYPFKMTRYAAQVCVALTCVRVDRSLSPRYYPSLPQGAPSSPTFSNFVMASLDRRLIQLAKEEGLFYTRYADDMTFSTNRKTIPQRVVHKIIDEIEQPNLSLRHDSYCEPFRVNPAKIHLCRAGARHQVTGLTVNEHVNVSRRYLKNLRAALYQLNTECHGNVFSAAMRSPQFRSVIESLANKYKHFPELELNESFFHIVERLYLQHLRGRIEFVRQVLGEDAGAYLSLRQSYNETWGMREMIPDRSAVAAGTDPGRRQDAREIFEALGALPLAD